MNSSVGLNFYVEKNIFPVFQKLAGLEKHLQIRESLYRLLGIPAVVFQNMDVLEVAAGSGENSLYVAAQNPKCFDICEPYPMATTYMEKLYQEFPLPHTKPCIFKLKLEDLPLRKQYDVVICEGWIGGMTEYERNMLQKLSGFVKVGGILILSFYPPIGGVSSFLRRLIAFRLTTKEESLEICTKKLVSAFSSHLKTLKDLSRTYEHWIQDSLLNPHIYVGPLSPRMIFEVLGDYFSVYHSVPTFRCEWRWYKSLYGRNRNINDQFLQDYDKYCHHLIDYRTHPSLRSPEKNRDLESLCIMLIQQAQEFESSGVEAFKKNLYPVLVRILKNVEEFHDASFRKAIEEAVSLLTKVNFNAKNVSQMSEFAGFFGREQCFMSLIREM